MKHLISTRDLSRDEALLLLDTASDMAATQRREVKKLPALRGVTVVNLFYEDSTRTRISFEAAEKRLSADVINFAAKGSSVSKGESLKDTAQTLHAIGADVVVIRHPASGTPQLLAERDWIDAPVLNAGDGMHEHPTQALLDAYTLRERIHGGGARGRDLDGVHVVIVGDILHSRYGVMERPLSEVLAEQQRKALEEPERAASWRYAREIISGYLEHEHDIDTRIEATATGWTLERMPSVDAAILRIGTWEILYNDEVPTEVAISEAIVAASEYSTDDSSRFVSGVLGAIADAVGSVGKQ